MKAEELIVGDLVRVAKNVCIPKGIIVTIRGIDMDNSFEEMNLRGCATCLAINDRYRMTGGVWVEYLEPIPLTTDILEKNGFILKPDGWLWCEHSEIEDKNYIFIQFKKGCEEVRLVEFNFVNNVLSKFERIKYVHELQHALKLCGIKKEIIL